MTSTEQRSSRPISIRDLLDAGVDRDDLIHLDVEGEDAHGRACGTISSFTSAEDVEIYVPDDDEAQPAYRGEFWVGFHIDDVTPSDQREAAGWLEDIAADIAYLAAEVA